MVHLHRAGPLTYSASLCRLLEPDEITAANLAALQDRGVDPGSYGVKGGRVTGYLREWRARKERESAFVGSSVWTLPIAGG
jgi:hypothetical protein